MKTIPNGLCWRCVVWKLREFDIMSHINVYDLNWNFIREFWCAAGYGIGEIGGVKKEGSYYFKRMN